MQQQGHVSKRSQAKSNRTRGKKPYYKNSKWRVSKADYGDSGVGLSSDPPYPLEAPMDGRDAGQDSPTSPPRSDLHKHPPRNAPNATIDLPDFDTDGIHPSRLALFAALEDTGDTGTISSSIMTPPGPEQRNHQQNQPPSHQPKTVQRGPNGINLNGEYRNQQQQHREHERDQRQRQSNGAPVPTGPGPMQSHIQVAKPYIFQQAIEGCLKDVGVAQAREDSIRLAGVQWIDSVRRALKLPVRTFDTAVIYYHKFRLVHSDGEYSFPDAAAASLFAACKIEDTLKKSRDILCAAHNLKISNRAEHLSPDDSSFEHHSRSIIGLERLMLESSSFDFRNRHPQHLLIKLARYYGFSKSSPIVKTAYKICLDLYRTFAPLKQCTATLAFACLELSGRLLGETDNHVGLQDITTGRDYTQWKISRAEVMETLLDLLELYTHYRTSTVIGPAFHLDTFLQVRIQLNEELNRKSLSRFTEYVPKENIDGRADVGSYAATVNGVSVGAVANGAGSTGGKHERSPTSPVTPGAGRQNGMRQKAGERGREGTVRFMLNPDRERDEKEVIAEYDIPTPALDVVSGGISGPGSTNRPSPQAAGDARPSRR